jgi:hypothetical protein
MRSFPGPDGASEHKRKATARVTGRAAEQRMENVERVRRRVFVVSGG